MAEARSGAATIPAGVWLLVMKHEDGTQPGPDALQGKVVVITGASRGIGRALAVELAARGMNVVLVGRDAERLADAAVQVSQHGVDVMSVVADVSSTDDWSRIRDGVLGRFGSVDVLVLNAGVSTAGPLVEHSLSEWEWVYETVLWGVVRGVSAFVPAMVEAGRGQVVITGSQAGLVPDLYRGHGPYVSAKAAVGALAGSLRAELEPQGVGVSLVMVGPTDTSLSSSLRLAEATEARLGDSDIEPMSQLRADPDAPPIDAAYPKRLSAEAVADRVADGIERNEAIIATHLSFRPVIEGYFDRVLAAYQPSEDA